MDKRTIWTLAICLPCLALVGLAWYQSSMVWLLVAGVPFALYVGFLVGVERTYKGLTGRKLDDRHMTEVLEDVL